MKIGISSYSFASYQRASGCDDLTLCRMAKEMGFDGIEFTDLRPERTDSQTAEEAADKLRAECERLSLPIFAYTVGANLLSEDIDAEMARVKTKIDVAVRLGAPLLRHDAAFALRPLPRYTWREGIAEMAPRIRLLAEYAALRGIRTCTENHGYVYQDPERVEALIRAVDHQNFGWLFDMGNFSVVDRTATEALGLAAPYIFHVHAKDMRLLSGDRITPSGFNRTRGGNLWRGTVLGHGDVPVAQTVAALKRLGYDGTVTLEFEGPEDNLSSLSGGLAYLKSLMQTKDYKNTFFGGTVMLKVGIVGVGNIAQSAHIPAYEMLTDRVKIVAVADINFERAAQVAERLGCAAYASVEELLAGTEVDYIDVCTWNGGHAPVAIAAARAGKPILCEKPMADSLEHALEMAEVVKETGVPFMMAMVTRYDDEPMYVHKLQEEGKLGSFHFAKALYTRRRGTPRGWFTDTKKSGGGPVIDLGVHCIDRSWFLMGRPRPLSVSATASYAIGDFKTKGVDRWCALDAGDGTFDTEDSATAYIRFENGAAMFAEIAWAQNQEPANYIKLYGDKAGVSFGPLTIYTENEEGYLADLTPDIGAKPFGTGTFRNEIAHFLDCLETGASPISPLEDGLTLQRILDGIYRSAKEGREVSV